MLLSAFCSRATAGVEVDVLDHGPGKSPHGGAVDAGQLQGLSNQRAQAFVQIDRSRSKQQPNGGIADASLTPLRSSRT